MGLAPLEVEAADDGIEILGEDRRRPIVDDVPVKVR